jgi:hypothetical protein
MSWLMIGGMGCDGGGGGGSGDGRRDQCLQRFTGVLNGVGGAVVWRVVGICRDLAMLCI